MATSLMLVVFPKAGGFAEPNFFNDIDLSGDPNRNVDIDIFYQQINKAASLLNFDIKQFNVLSAGYYEVPNAILEITPGDENLITLLSRKFSVRMKSEIL